MTRTQRVPYGSMLKGNPLGIKSAGPQPAPKPEPKAKPAKAKKGARK